jgi:hypothetical protein
MSSVISLVIIFGFILLIRFVAPFKFKEARKRIVISVLSIFAAVQILYFLNVIPPLPLAIRDIGVFHNVTRLGSSYVLTQESVPAYKRFIRGNEYHAVAGEPVYVWSSVYAPTKLTTNIIHEWQYYDRAESKWRTASRVTFAISGGRDGGYRGYSFKQNTFPGRWRVNVLTPHERTIGQINFTIIETEEEVELEEVKK